MIQPRLWRGSWTVVLIAAWSVAGAARAEVAQVGRGVEALSAAPLYYSSPSPDDCGVSRMLYRKTDLAELPPNVPITAIELDKRLGHGPQGGAFAVYVKNSSATSLSNGTTVSAALSGTTQVHTTEALALPASAEWVRFTFAEPFMYMGDALEVVTVWDSMSGARDESLLWGTHATGTTVAKLFAYGPDPLAETEALGAGSPANRPNTRFIFDAPNAGWLVVESGLTLLSSGASYANNTAFSNGVTVPQRLRLTNKGGAALNLGAISFSDVINTMPMVVTGPPAMLAPGASADVELSHSTDQTSGTVGYKVNIASDAPMQPFSYSLSGFVTTAAPRIEVKVCDEQGRCSPVGNNGTVNLGSQVIDMPRSLTVQVSNVGTGTLTLSPVMIEGNIDEVRAMPDGALPMSLSPQRDASLGVSYAPKKIGMTQARVRIENNDAARGEFTVLMVSYGVPPSPGGDPDIEISYHGTEVPKGSTHKPTAAKQYEYTITNKGDATLNVSLVQLTRPADATCRDVNVLPGAEANVAPRESTTFTVDSPSCEAQSFSIMVTSNSLNEKTYRFDVEPVVDPPDIDVTDEVDLGASVAGAKREVSLVVHNRGVGVLRISNAVVNNPVGVLAAPTISSIQSIEPGGTGEFKLVFWVTDDEGAEELSFELEITSNDPDTPTAAVSFRGTIVPPGTEPSGPTAGFDDEMGGMGVGPDGKPKSGACSVQPGAHAQAGWFVLLVGLGLSVSRLRRRGPR